MLMLKTPALEAYSSFQTFYTYLATRNGGMCFKIKVLK